MKNYTVVLMNANHVEEYGRNGRRVFDAIRKALTSFRPGFVRPAVLRQGDAQEAIQVHRAEQLSTPSLLLVKAGILRNVLDCENLEVRDDLVEKMAELQTAASLMHAAEENFLLAVSKAIYRELPMDAYGNRLVTGDAAEAKLRKNISEFPALRKSAKYPEYAERVFAYITKNGEHLSEGIFTGAI